MILRVEEPVPEHRKPLLLQAVNCGIYGQKPWTDRWHSHPSPSFRQGRISNHPSATTNGSYWKAGLLNLEQTSINRCLQLPALYKRLIDDRQTAHWFTLTVLPNVFYDTRTDLRPTDLQINYLSIFSTPFILWKKGNSGPWRSDVI